MGNSADFIVAGLTMLNAAYLWVYFFFSFVSFFFFAVLHPHLDMMSSSQVIFHDKHI
jgi:hypothetical protein